MIHFFNYYGYYTGTFYPKEFLNSGDIIVKQTKHYISKIKRLVIAKEFIKGASHGLKLNLKRYKPDTTEFIDKITELEKSIDNQKSVSALMGIEGNIRETYYKTFNIIIKQDINFKKRVKNPPDNMINALISFLNSIVYTLVLKEIYKTQLNPTISYLHEPGYRRFSLSLDIAEIFKPILGDRIIFNLLNNGQLSQKDFDKDLNYAYLKEEGRRTVINAFNEKIKQTILHKTLKKRVSYERLIRLELYKLIKHILEEKEYKSLKIWQ